MNYFSLLSWHSVCKLTSWLYRGWGIASTHINTLPQQLMGRSRYKTKGGAAGVKSKGIFDLRLCSIYFIVNILVKNKGRGQ